MKRIVSYLVAGVLVAPLAGCIVAERPGPRRTVVRECPPAHHWEDGGCVHNGHGHDHDHDRDDHDHDHDHRH